MLYGNVLMDVVEGLAFSISAVHGASPFRAC
jgi:hypothetical protein